MKNMKRVIALLMCAMMVFALAACTTKEEDKKDSAASTTTAVAPGETTTAGAPETAAPVDDTAKATIKFGLICLHDENSTYDANFINSLKEAQANLGLSDDQIVIKKNIPETSECYDAAMELVDAGCNVIFADSFGHEQFLLQAASECPDVQFCHATGDLAHTEKLANFHNGFASIYEGRYLAGVAAGLKLNEMIEAGKITAEQAVIGYVGAYTYAEVISGYTSFYLGAKSICPSATMKVQFTGSWYDETAEKEAANLLIESGCVLISQHADSMGAPTACENAGVPNISYNGSTVSACPNTFIVASRINWAPYMEYIMSSVANKTEIAVDWVGGIKEGSVLLTEINEKAAAAGTADKIAEVKAGIMDGSIKVFDTATFTVNGETLTSYLADVDFDEAYTGDTEVIIDGAFLESVFRSAPYFNITIDGVEQLNSKF